MTTPPSSPPSAWPSWGCVLSLGQVPERGAHLPKVPQVICTSKKTTSFKCRNKKNLGGNEIRQGRKYSKIRQVSVSLQKSLAGDPRQASGDKNNPGIVSRSSLLMVLPTFISQLRGVPSCKEASSRGLSTHRIAGHRGLNAEQALQNQHFVKKV